MGSFEAVALFVIATCFFSPVDVEAKAFLKVNAGCSQEPILSISEFGVTCISVIQHKNDADRRDASNWCSRSTPCGWEVYRPFLRNVEYFIKSPCDCQDGTRCVRVSDDISISAYVHLCRPLNEDIVVWPHDNYDNTDTVPTF